MSLYRILIIALIKCQCKHKVINLLARTDINVCVERTLVAVTCKYSSKLERD